jgi:hypothetical protein
MSENYNEINLIDYSHDRKNSYKKTADQLYNIINNFAERKELKNFYKYFENSYNLPEKIIKQSIKQRIAKLYLLKNNKFDISLKLSLQNILKSILNYSVLFYAIFFANFTKKKGKKFELIIDAIVSSAEMMRWKKLLDIFGSDNVLCVSKDANVKQKFPKNHIYQKKIFRDINILDLLKSIFFEFSIGLWVVTKASLKVRVNLLPITIKIIHEYLSYKSLFECNKSDYLIQEKHYGTQPIKNYLYKKSGGIASTSIQKNIIQTDPIYFYMDLDILFSFGEGGCERLYDYGGRIGCIKPVGSLFMESLWFEKKKQIKKKYDIAILGVNMIDRLDSFDKFQDDYYSLYNWAAKLSLENPNYNIVLIHHASVGREQDEYEKNLLKGSNVKVLDKNLDSYEAAFSSKFAITYSSTMGFELNAHNLLTLFVDPGYRSSFLPEQKHEYLDRVRINSYEDLSKIAKKVIDNKTFDLDLKNNSDNLCLESSNVAYNIHKYLCNY